MATEHKAVVVVASHGGAHVVCQTAWLSVYALKYGLTPNCNSIRNPLIHNPPMSENPTTEEFDLLVIGAGSGGATVALEAAQLGIRCAVFDHREAGGTCVHRGCIPKKLLWHGADILNHAQRAPAYGLSINSGSDTAATVASGAPAADDVAIAAGGTPAAAVTSTVDYASLQQRSRRYTDAIGHWFEGEFKRQGVCFIAHRAVFKDAHTVEAGGIAYRGKHIVIAVGSRPARPDFPGAEMAITSDEFFNMKQLPRRAAVAGSGFIAIELACALNAFGVKVDMIIRRDNLSHQFDDEMAAQLAHHLTAQGITIRRQHRCERLEKRQDGAMTVHFTDGQDPLECDCLIWAVGRDANVEQLGLDRARLELNDNGFIATDTDQRTNVKHIYALGDVAGRVLLTPVAIRAARYLVRRLYGKENVSFDYSLIPSVVYAHPPLASIGLSSSAAKEQYGADITEWRHQFTPLAEDFADGHAPKAMIKMITQTSSGLIIGLHILAPGADEMMQGFAVAITMGATKADFDRCVAIHPTAAEEIVTIK